VTKPAPVSQRNRENTGKQLPSATAPSQGKEGPIATDGPYARQNPKEGDYEWNSDAQNTEKQCPKGGGARKNPKDPDATN